MRHVDFVNLGLGGIMGVGVTGLVIVFSCGLRWLCYEGYFCKLFGHQTEWQDHKKVIGCRNCYAWLITACGTTNGPHTTLPVPRWETPPSWKCRFFGHRFTKERPLDIHCRWCNTPQNPARYRTSRG